MVKIYLEIRSGHNLIVADAFSSDPYVKISAYDDSGAVKSEIKTPVQSSTVNPKWNWKGSIEYTGTLSRLEFNVWDSDTFGKDDFMGCAGIDHATVLQQNMQLSPLKLVPGDSSHAAKVKSKYEKRGPDTALGSIDVMWNWVDSPPSPTARRPSSSAQPAAPLVEVEPERSIYIKPLVVTGIPPTPGVSGLMGVTCEQSKKDAPKHQKQELKGRVNSKGDIRWNDWLRFDGGGGKTTCTFEVVSERGKKEVVGLAALLISEKDYAQMKESDDVKPMEIQLARCKQSYTAPVGNEDDEEEEEEESEEDDEPAPSPTRKILLHVEVLWVVNDPVTGAPPTPTDSQPGSHASFTPVSVKSEPPVEKKERIPQTIEITILKGSNLIKMDGLFGKSDPYVTCMVEGSIGEILKKTHTEKKTLDPVWDEEIEVDLKADLDTYIVHLNVWDWDMMNDEWMGYTSLILKKEHLLKAVQSMCEWTLDLTARPQEDHQAKDQALIRNNKGSLGNITIGVRAQDPPFPEMTRVMVIGDDDDVPAVGQDGAAGSHTGESGYIETYCGTDDVDGERVQMYVVLLDSGEKKTISRNNLDLLGDIEEDSPEEELRKFNEKMDTQAARFTKVMKERNAEFFDTNERFFDAAHQASLTPSELQLQHHYVEYGDTITHFNQKFEHALAKHQKKYCGQFKDVVEMAASTAKIQNKKVVIQQEQEKRKQLHENWEKGRADLQRGAALTAAQVKSAKVHIISAKMLDASIAASYIIVQGGALDKRSTVISKTTAATADYTALKAKGKGATFADFTPGDTGMTVNLIGKSTTSVELKGQAPTQDMTESDKTFGLIKLQIPGNCVCKGEEKSVSRDLGWKHFTSLDDEEIATSLRLKLVLELKDHVVQEIEVVKEEAGLSLAEQLAQEEEAEERAQQEEEDKKIPSVLEVDIVKGTNLVVCDIFSSDPYCVVELLPAWPGVNKVFAQNKTKTQKSTLNPKWREKFTYDLFELLEPKKDVPDEQMIKLRFTIWDDDIDADDFMGYCEVVFERDALKKMIVEKKKFSLPLEKRPSTDLATIEADEKLWKAKKKYFGEIHIVCRTSEPKLYGSKTEQAILSMEHDPDEVGTPKTLALTYKIPELLADDVSFEAFGKSIRITNVKPSSSAFKVGLPLGTEITEYENIPATGEDMKKCLASLRSAVKKSPKNFSLTVQLEDVLLCTFKTKKEGEYTLEFNKDYVKVSEVNKKTDAEENGLHPGQQVYAINSQPVMQFYKSPEEIYAKNKATELSFIVSNLSKSEKKNRLNQDEIKLNLFVRIIKAKKLIRADSMILRKSDPYIVASAVDSDGTPLLGRRAKPGLPLKTDVDENTLNPQWNFSFPSAIILGEGERIRFEVWDSDLIGTDEFLGLAELDPWQDSGREDGASIETWLTLLHRGNQEDKVAARHSAGDKPLGELLISFKGNLVTSDNIGLKGVDDITGDENEEMKGITLDEDGHAYQSVRLREGVTVEVQAAKEFSSTSNLTDDKVYAVVKLLAPPASAHRTREFTTHTASKILEELHFESAERKGNANNGNLQFDDCGEDAVEGFCVQLFKKSFFGSDDFIGRTTILKSDEELWAKPSNEGSWHALMPRAKKDKNVVGQVRLSWGFLLGSAQLVKKFEDQTFGNVSDAAAALITETADRERRQTIYQRMRGEDYTLAIEVLSCESLPKQGSATVECTCGGTLQKTDPSPKSTSPEWETANLFFPLAVRNEVVSFTVKIDGTPVGSAKFSGYEQFALEGTESLTLFDEKNNTVGVITFGFEYSHAKHGGFGYLPELKGDAREGGEFHRSLLLKPFDKTATTREVLSGLLIQESCAQIEVIQAAALPGVDSGAIQCKIQIEYMRHEIDFYTSSTSARFPFINKTHSIPLEAKGGADAESIGPDGRVLLKVYDKNSVFADQIVGICEIDVVSDYEYLYFTSETDEMYQFLQIKDTMEVEVNPEVVTLQNKKRVAQHFKGFTSRKATHLNGKHTPTKETYNRVFDSLKKEEKLFPMEVLLETVAWHSIVPRTDEKGDPIQDDAKILQKFGTLGRLLIRHSTNMNIEKREVAVTKEDEGPPCISLQIIEGEHLIARDLLTSDPYVMVRFGEEMRKTAYKKSTLSPIWKETLEDIPFEDANTVLELTCYDFDVDADDFMGHVEIDPFAFIFSDSDGAGSNRTKQGWVSLAPRSLNKEDEKLYEKHNANFGRLRINVTLKGDLTLVKNAKFDISKADAIDKENNEVPVDELINKGGQVSIWVDSAEMLPKKTKNQVCKVSFNRPGSREIKSKFFMTRPPGSETASPSWLAGPFSYHFFKYLEKTTPADLKEYDIFFEVFGENDSKIGHFTQSALDFTREVGTKTVELRSEDDSGDANLGRINFKWELKFGQKNLCPWLDPEVRKDLKKYLTDTNSALRVTVTVARCANLHNIETFGKIDPYVVISCGPHQSQTRVVSSNCNPIYNHVTTWEIDTFSQPIEFFVKDKELLGSDRELGQTRLNLAAVSDESGEETIKLQPSPSMKQGDDLGNILVKYAIEKVKRTAVSVKFCIHEAESLADPNLMFDITPTVLLRVFDQPPEGVASATTTRGKKILEFSSKQGKGKNPTFSESTTINLHTENKVLVELSVWETDTCLGTVEEELDFIGDDNEGDKWFALRPRDSNNDDAMLESKCGTLGQLHCAWSVDTPEARKEREMKRELRLADLYKANILALEVIRARNLIDSGLFTSISPICRIKFPSTCEDKDAETTNVASGTNPVWGKDTSFKLSTVLLNQDVLLEVIDKGLVSNTVLGTASFNPWENAVDVKGERWVKINAAAGSPTQKKGPEILVRWNLTNEFAPTRTVLQLWVEKGIDIVVPKDDVNVSGSDTARILTEVSLGPYERKTELIECQKSGEDVHGGLCTVSWGELFTYDPIPPSHVFTFRIFDERVMTKTIPLGKVEWNWDAEADVSEGSKTLEILPESAEQKDLVKKVASLGAISIKWKTTSKQGTGQVRDGQQVKLNVMKTRGLPQVDSTMRVYCVVSFGSTKAISDPTTGELNYAAVFKAANEGQSLRIEIWEKNYGLASDTHIGYCILPYGDDEAAFGEEWFRLLPRSGVEADFELSAKNDGLLGEVKLNWEWDSELFAASGLKKKKKAQKNLSVTILNGQNLTPQDTSGLSDPYIILKVGEIEVKTAVKHNTLDPHFDETFLFEDCNVKWPLLVTCWDYDPESSDDFMGRAKVALSKNEGKITVPLTIRSGNKDDVQLQEKYQGRLGSLSLQWKVLDVEEEKEVAGDAPTAVVSTTVLGMKKLSSGRAVVRIAIGKETRSTLPQQAQEVSFDKEGMREQWKIPVFTEDSFLLELIDVAKKKPRTIAALRMTFAEFTAACGGDNRMDVQLLKVTPREVNLEAKTKASEEYSILEGTLSGDLIDLEMRLTDIAEVRRSLEDDAKADDNTVAHLSGGADVSFCCKCKKAAEHSGTPGGICHVCGTPLVPMSEITWRPGYSPEDMHKRAESTATQWGSIAIGNIAKADETKGFIGAASARIGQNIFFYGGFNRSGFNTNLQQYNIHQSRWQAFPHDSAPSAKNLYKRYGSSMVAVDGHKLIMFGGYGPGGLDSGLTAIGGTLETDTHFVEVADEGDYWNSPDVALSPGGAAVEPGAAPSGYFDSVLSYDLREHKWEKLTSHGPGWDFRACHSAVVYKGKMIVYGGWSIFVKQTTYDTSRRIGRLAKPNIKYSTIECRRGDVASYNFATGKWSWIKPVVAENAPLPRSHHTAVLKPNSCFMVVFGGVTVDAERTTASGDITRGQLHSDDSDSDEDEDADSHSLHHQAQHLAQSGSGLLYLNDLQILDLRNKVWSCVTDSGDVPAPRAEHGASICGGSMVIVGGRNAEQVFGEGSCYQFSFHTGLWSRIAIHSSISQQLSTGRPGRCTDQKNLRGRWGMCVATFKRKPMKNISQAAAAAAATLQAPPATNSFAQSRREREKRGQNYDYRTADEANAREAEERRKTVKERRTQQEKRSADLLRSLGDEEGAAGVGHKKILGEEQVLFNILLVGGCERQKVRPLGHSSQGSETHQTAPTSPYARLPNKSAVVVQGVLHPPATAADSVLCNPGAPLACDTKRLRIPVLRGACATAALWQIVPAHYSAKIRLGTVSIGGKESPADPSAPKKVKKVKPEQLDGIVERLGKLTYRARPTMARPEEPTPTVAKRSPARIEESMGRLSEGHTTGKVGKSGGKLGKPFANPGETVKLRYGSKLQGIDLIAGTPCVVVDMGEKKIKRDCTAVKFKCLPEPVVLENDALRIPESKGAAGASSPMKLTSMSPKKKGTPASLATAPPRGYVFPEDWLEDDEAGQSDSN